MLLFQSSLHKNEPLRFVHTVRDSISNRVKIRMDHRGFPKNIGFFGFIKACPRDAIATAISLSHLMGCVGFNISVHMVQL